MTDLYVPYCKNKTASEELLASHRSYLTVGLSLNYLAPKQIKWLLFYDDVLIFVAYPKSVWYRDPSVITADQANTAHYQVPSAP